MNQMSSSLDDYWSNRRNGPRDNKRTPEEQEKELYYRSPYLTQFLEFMGVTRTAQFERLAAYQRARSAILFFSPVDATR